MPDVPRKPNKAKPAPRRSGGKPPKRPPVRQGSGSGSAAERAAGFDFGSLAPGYSSPAANLRNRKKPAWMKLLFVAGGFMGACLIAGLAVVAFSGGGDSVVIEPIGDRTVDEYAQLKLTVAVSTPDGFDRQLLYSLESAPQGARINEQTGEFVWQPSEKDGGKLFDVAVRVTAARTKKFSASTKFSVFVNEINRPPVLEPIENRVVPADSKLTVTANAHDPDSPPQPLNYRLMPDAPQGAIIDVETGRIEWDARHADLGDRDKVYRFEVRATEATPGGLGATLGFDVRVSWPEPSEAASATPVPAIVTVPETPVTRVQPPQLPSPTESPPTVASPVDEGRARILALVDGSTKLFSRKEYPTLRKIYADRFQREHAGEIKQAYGDDYQEMTGWLQANAEIKEEFYTAIEPGRDDVPAALALMNLLRKTFPDKIVSYANLAIATAVTWDRARGGVYDYARHAQRTKSNMPREQLDAIENFKYLLDNERLMQGRILFMPWEFLTLVVNHKTPVGERQWALQNYLSKVRMFGKCYHDVPYDNTMLESGSAKAQLNGQDYTLKNLDTYGGVCAMQADFASRVGKSMGVPAAYVRGEATHGEHHAWVMWVELVSATKNGVRFSLQSHGRYRGDKYYIGDLNDPHTGQKITDRQLELRLHTVGMDPAAKRHAELIMKSYSMLREEKQLDVAGQIMFLNKVIDLSPGNEAAWKALAGMSRDGVVTKKHNVAMMKTLDNLFRTFEQFPDFTWEVFDDLIAYQDVRKQRAKLFGRLVMLYEGAARPDLACEARLKYAEYLVADEAYVEAVEGLAYTIKKFPGEGRYVPKMLDRLEAICQQVDGAAPQLVPFYREYLPMIPQTRGTRASPFCIKMYQRGIQRFKEGGDLQSAQLYQMKLAALQGGRGLKR